MDCSQFEHRHLNSFLQLGYALWLNYHKSRPYLQSANKYQKDFLSLCNIGALLPDFQYYAPLPKHGFLPFLLPNLHY